MVERRGEEMGRGWSGFGVKKAYAVLTQICYLFEHEVIKGRIDTSVVVVVRRLHKVSTVGENSNSGHQP
jgi:hypothetical protein